MADASNDDFIEELEDHLGLEGYGRWWKMLETIAAAMEKDRNDPSAKHTVGKWCEKLKAKKKVLANFLEFCRLKKKISVSFFDQKTLSFRECSGNVSEMFQESNQNIMKITCPNILKLRDEYSRKTGQYPERVAQEAEADKEKEINLLTSLTVDNSVKGGDKKSFLPVPKIPAQEKSFNDEDLVAAAAACCSVLQRRNLTPDDEKVLRLWLKKHDFPNVVLPIIAEAANKYAMKNTIPPATLRYFVDRVEEKSAKRH